MTKNRIKILAVIGILSFATICSAHEYMDFKQKTVTQHEAIYYYSNDEIEMINHATDIVKKYWDFTSGAEVIYNLFSESYKNKLKQTKKINNAMDYTKYVNTPEFDRNRQTYIKAWIEDKEDKKQKGFFKIVKIAVLAEWSKEVYERMDIFTFVIIKEGNDWKIENIMRWEEKQG